MWCAYEGLCALGADAEAKALASATRDESISAMYPSLAASGINLVSHKPPRSRRRRREGEDYRHRRRRERRLAAVRVR